MKRSNLVGCGLAALVSLGAGCFRSTVSEIELDIPAMRTEACARIVGEAIGRLGVGPFEPIRDVRIDVGQRKAWVSYDNVRLGRRNVEVAVRHAGFAVNDLPANEEVRGKLPPECRGHD